MLELLRSIPGPQFLILFPLLVIAGIAIGRMQINNGRSGLRMPELSEFSPSSIACLRGGWELVLKTAVFSLWQRGVIELVNDTGSETEKTRQLFGTVTIQIKSKQASRYLFRRADGASLPAERIEMAVWRFLETERKPEDFFKAATLQSFVETHVRQSQTELERSGLLRSADQHSNAWLTYLAVLVAVEGIGITKLLLGLSHDKPVAFLAIMMVVAFLAVSIALNPSTKLTPLGKAFLKKLEEHFGWLKDAVKDKEAPGIDPAYAFAIFGTTVLAGTLLYAPFSEAFPARTTGGCGGSGCGGSGCGGGGCSGDGGCGGCGGGD
ncbi:MAG: TIGR04222 domain-containing membrane protein [Deltaproteobacteria bacterium]|nr:TIGR04222 domain-containing membrane protein [Deltaproteobacteria bacterium]